MIGQPAKVLRPGDVRRALAWACRRRHGLRNKVMILLSVKAGLRASEISALTWPMLIDSNGDIGSCVELPAICAKYGSGRRIPIHKELYRALVALRASQRSQNGPVIQ